MPENLSRYEKIDKYIVIFLGVNPESKEELLKVIREHDTENDWTHKKSDEWMLRFCENIMKESEVLKQECEKYGFYYFDTFKNREKTLKEIIGLIKRLQSL